MVVDDPKVPIATTPELVHRLDVLEVLRKYPQADENILNAIGGDRQALEAHAKRLQELATPPPPAPPAAVTAPPPAVPSNDPPAGGGAVPIPGPGGVTPPALQANREYEDLRFKVEHKTATEQEREAFFTMSLRGDNGQEGWNPHMAKLKERPGRS